MLRIVPAFLCLLLLCCTDVPAEAPASGMSSDGPNIVLIVADDHGKDALGCYGNPVIRTPHLDALAAEGIRYDRAFCTTSSCSASRSVILSGLHNHRNGQFGHSHDVHHFLSYDTVRSLPVLLEEQGYRTARVGKYHLAPESVYRFQTVLPGNPRSPVEMADAAFPLMEGDSSPFFLYYCVADPHRSGVFADDLPHAPDRFGNRPAGYPGITEVTYTPEEVLVPDYLTDTPATRAELAQYYQAVTRLDQGVGRIVENLKRAGQYDNTLIIYISDNGAAFPGAKTTLYEPGMQLPCIVKLPGSREASVSDEMVSWTDLVPTALDAAGVAVDTDRFDGRSMLAEGPPPDSLIYASHTFHEITMYYPIRVARGQRYKLLVNFAHQLPYPFASDLYESATWQSILSEGRDSLGEKSINNFLYRPRFELYDVLEDPQEAENLADDPRYAGQLERLQQAVYNMQVRSKDPWLVKWEYE
ncbi:MAG: sulfatase [Lewinella sp.]